MSEKELWVCQPDGSIQCLDIAGVPLAVMRRQLAMLVGDENILDERQDHVFMPQLCGLPTGVRNAYLLTETGYHILFHGFVGPGGFTPCDHGAKALTADRPPIDVDSFVAASGVTSVLANPVLVRELIGRRLRVYRQGDAISGDYVADRVNIVTLNNRIVDIWYG